jgi:spermidine/putrescine transport system permease protein
MARLGARSFDATRLPGFRAVALAAFALLYLPILTLVVFSFNESASMSDWGGLSLRWYRDAWANEVVQEAAARSLVLASLAAILSTAVATPAALGHRAAGPLPGAGRDLRRSSTSPCGAGDRHRRVAPHRLRRVRSATGYQGFGYLLLAAHGLLHPLRLSADPGALETMDPTLEQAASDLYASPWSAFRRDHAAAPHARASPRARCWPS